MRYFRKKEKTTYEIISDRLISATPILCVMIYLFIGFEWQLWHPGWVIFLAIPVMPMILKPRGFRAAFPIFILIVYLVLGFVNHWWHPGWVIFLSIPVFYIFFPEKKQKTIFIDEDDDTIDIEID